MDDADRQAALEAIAAAFDVPVEILTMTDAEFHRYLHGPPGPGALDPRDRT